MNFTVQLYGTRTEPANRHTSFRLYRAKMATVSTADPIPCTDTILAHYRVHLKPEASPLAVAGLAWPPLQ